MARVLLATIIFVICAELCFSWVYHGCFKDKPVRHLETMAYQGIMTVQKCIQLCSFRGNFYAGVEFGQCFCGNHIKPDYEKFDDSQCSNPCSGDATQKCGASLKINIYSTYKYEGCYLDKSRRILEGPETTSDAMTTDMCINICKNANKVFALTESSTVCVCGNSLKPYEKKPDTDCDYECKGAPTEKCGGFWRGSLYRV